MALIDALSVYGVSNDLLGTPWPKVGAGKTALTQALDGLPDDRPLFHLLRDDFIHPDEHLPNTGIPQAWERMLSAAFVKWHAQFDGALSLVNMIW